MSVTTEKSSVTTAVRPFTVAVTPEAELEALRARLAATHWLDRELVTDHSQGVQQAVISELAGYWAQEYDWRRCEAKLAALPHFITEIDGLDIHFIHVRSRHENALPVIITHGWPGSVIELLAVIDPVTNPTAHGGSAADAFDVVIPSIPGSGVLRQAAPDRTGPRPGNSRRSSQQRSARALGRCANRSKHRPTAQRLRIHVRLDRLRQAQRKLPGSAAPVPQRHALPTLTLDGSPEPTPKAFVPLEATAPAPAHGRSRQRTVTRCRAMS